ncbi:glutamine synthetase family protein [uncultured Roseobacter sp.]|uniref:glutamine synthetase family protein n=1 Tax=uncultured Roseobacter sp. TaxID=114847 RepID=UPI00260FA284|nr:glutamine synthetase family protein [uncultured Roseobacter sp.]
MGDKLEISDGALARLGLLDAGAIAAAEALLAQVQDSDLETIRILFPDQHGVLRGKTIVAAAFASAFSSGIAAPSTLFLKDTAHRTVYPVWDGSGDSPVQGAGDVLLVLDPTTFRVLPHAPGSAWILCDAVMKSGAPLPFAPRTVLRRAVAQLAATGLQLRVGLEVEFHVFAVTDDALSHADATMPPAPPQTRNLAPGYQFLTETVYARLEPVAEKLRRMIQAVGLPLRSMEVEMGPSQLEFTFDPADPMTHADHLVMLRTLVKEVCAQDGLHATFMSRPKVENGCASGWHLHQSLLDDTGASVMMPAQDGTLSPQAAGWIAGLLDHAVESCLLTTPTVNGYKRYQPFKLAPDRVVWGRDNRGAMLRALMAPDDPASRVENRVPEAAANPYYAFASQILSGLDGITRGLTPPPPVENPYADAAQVLPASLGAAIEAFETSAFYRAALGDGVVDYLVRLKRAEWERYLAHVSDWEQAEYFGLY